MIYVYPHTPPFSTRALETFSLLTARYLQSKTIELTTSLFLSKSAVSKWAVCARYVACVTYSTGSVTNLGNFELLTLDNFRAILIDFIGHFCFIHSADYAATSFFSM